MPIWKPFSFYPSSQIFRKKTPKSPEKNNFQSVCSELDLFFSISGLGIHILDISDEFKYIYIFNFFEKYFRKLVHENVRHVILTNIFDE